MSLPLWFVILTLVSSIISNLFIQEKSEKSHKKRLVKPLTKAGWISFLITLILGGLTICFSIRDERKADAAIAELNDIKSQGKNIEATTNKLQYPLPMEIEVSFDLEFKLKTDVSR